MKSFLEGRVKYILQKRETFHLRLKRNLSQQKTGSSWMEDGKLLRYFYSNIFQVK